MKILQVGKFYPVKGGVEKVMYDIMTGLSANKINCDMLCAAIPGQSSGEFRINEYSRLYCMPTLLKLAATMLSPRMILKMRSLRNSYDVVHIHHPDPMACIALFFSGYKGKVILHWHSDILKQKLLLKLFAPFQQWLINRADVVVGTTPVYVKESPFLQTVQDKVTHIPIGIEPLQPDAVRVEEIRRLYKGKKIIFSLGRLVEYKGFSYLIDAASKLGDDYVILIGGTGPLQKDLQTQIDKQGLQERVLLLGYIHDDDIPNYFEASELFVLSSVMKTEAFAIVQIEAMSCGTPIVATRIKESGVSWVNQHKISGLNVPVRDAHALADAILRFFSDKDLQHRLAKGAKERFNTFFTRDQMTRKCMDLYSELL